MAEGRVFDRAARRGTSSCSRGRNQPVTCAPARPRRRGVTPSPAAMAMTNAPAELSRSITQRRCPPHGILTRGRHAQYQPPAGGPQRHGQRRSRADREPPHGTEQRLRRSGRRRGRRRPRRSSGATTTDSASVRRRRASPATSGGTTTRTTSCGTPWLTKLQGSKVTALCAAAHPDFKPEDCERARAPRSRTRVVNRRIVAKYFGTGWPAGTLREVPRLDLGCGSSTSQDQRRDHERPPALAAALRGQPHIHHARLCGQARRDVAQGLRAVCRRRQRPRRRLRAGRLSHAGERKAGSDRPEGHRRGVEARRRASPSRYQRASIDLATEAEFVARATAPRSPSSRATCGAGACGTSSPTSATD